MEHSPLSLAHTMCKIVTNLKFPSLAVEDENALSACPVLMAILLFISLSLRSIYNLETGFPYSSYFV